MATEDEEKLVINVTAKLADLEKQMAKANALTTRTYDAMERSARRATRGMETDFARSTSRINQALAATSARVGVFGNAFSSLGARALASVAAFASLSAVIYKTRSALNEFGDIADKSAQAGLDPEFFQELAYQASLAGVGIEDISGALNTFNKNAGLAVVGKGKMVTALKALDVELLENIRNATTQEQRIRLAVDAMNAATTASQKAALATAMFGDSGTKLAAALQGGSAQMEATARKARELGIIVDSSLIAKADELGDQLDTATQVMSVQFSQALVNLAPVLVSTAKLAADVASAIAKIVDSWQSLNDMSSQGLASQQMMLTQESANLAMQLSKNRSEMKAVTERQLDPATALATDGNDATTLALRYTELSGSVTEMSARRTEIAKQLSDIDAVLATRKQMESDLANKPAATETVTDLPPLSSGTRSAAASDAVKQADAVKQLIDNLQIERAQIGMSETEIAKLNALRQAGAAATEEQKAQIVAIIDASTKERAAMQAAQANLELMKSASTDFLSTFRQGLVSGESAWESFGNAAMGVLDKIASKIETDIVDALFGATTTSGTSTGLLGGLFSLFTGTASAGGGINHFANGTSFAPGGVAMVGEAGPEKVILPRGSRVVPNHRLSADGGGGQQNVKVDVGVSVDNDGNLQAYVKNVAVKTSAPIVKAGLEGFSKHHLPKRVREIATDPRRRG